MKSANGPPELLAWVGHSKMRVLLVARDPAPILPRLQDRWSDIEWVRVSSDERGSGSLAGIEVAYLWDYRSRVLRELWPELTDLRWVHVAAAGVDAFLFPEMLQGTVTLTNSRGAFDESVAEFGLALMLAFAKRLHLTMPNQQAAKWQHFQTQLLSGKTVGIVGFGAIGHLVGRKARALGMRVLGVRREGQAHPDADQIYGLRELPEVLRQSDYVVMVLPHTPETQKVIGEAELREMQSHAVLINIGRGSAVDEVALAMALEAGAIGGAGLDVFEREPLKSESPLWHAPNTVITPHMASDADDWQQRLAEVFSENLRRYRAGEPLLNQIDKVRGY
jgi:phosphoglycerate dehydrogenase-like enzyme